MSSPSPITRCSFDNKNEIDYLKSKMNASQGAPSPQPSENSSAAPSKCQETRRKRSTGIHLNNLWSLWYGVLGCGIQAYTVVKGIKRLLGYSLLYWPEDISLPYLELNCSLGLVGAAVLLLPIFFVCAVFKVGNLANDGFKLGRQIGMCSKEPPAEVLSHGGRCSLFKHGGPTAPFVHLVMAFCLLLPKLLMEAKLIEAGFLSQEWIWKTDLDFMVVHRDRLVVLSFMTSNSTNALPSSISQARIVSGTNKPQSGSIFSPTPPGVPLNHNPIAHTVIKTLKDFIGHENHTNFHQTKDPELGHTLSLEYINLAIALMVYSVRYSAIFWSSNKCLGIVFSVQLLINSVHILLSYCGMTILYKVQIAGVWKSLPLLKHTNFVLMSNRSTPFLLNAQVTLGLYLLSTLLVVASSLILYFYGHTRFNEFLNRECQRKIITLKRDSINKWSYFTHCAALCVLISVGICYAPLLHDNTFVYKGSLDDITLACIIGGILHLFLWVVIWLFLTIKQRWIFKLRVVVGRASVKQARSLRLITDVDLSRNIKDAPDQPLLVVANGRTYGVMDVSPQKAIMNIVKKSTTVRRAIHHDATPCQEEDEEQIYWLRPALSNQQPSPDQAKQLCCFTKKEKQKVTFNETASTSNNRGKINGSKTRRVPGMDEDDGDYATLRELPLPPVNRMNNNENDTVSEEGKLLACVHDENITYASNNQDLNPPLDYEDPSPLLTPDPLTDTPDSSIPLLMHNNSNTIQSDSSQTPRCLRRADSGMPHEEMNSRSDSISTQSSASPPEAPESNHSESSSGVHSNDSRDQKQTRRATSVVDLVQPPPREEVHWKSFSLQRNVQPPTSSSFNLTSPLPVSSLEKEAIPNVILEEGESTVIIRRKSCRPNVADTSQTSLETFGRATNMRMVSFTEKSDLSNMQSTSATLPHYPTQPLPNIYPNCSTMPLPPHTSVQTNLGLGNSCNIYPRQHSTIPTHHNGVTVKMYNGTNGLNAQYPVHNRFPCKQQDAKSTDVIYSRIYRNPNVYHPSS
ncbi:hypothetical protein WA026_012100 [Henosepilachna vigintioctopunctata]|uniref:Protein tincar n=1 Tax=Henosepilachna vigintioctopunctata TaxID=420089 RepID=A0AAW1VD54_9CUCU